jgi:hypothetical protein
LVFLNIATELGVLKLLFAFKIPKYAMLYIDANEMFRYCTVIVSYTPERAATAGDSSDLNSPFKLNPGERVELSTCSRLVSKPASGS